MRISRLRRSESRVRDFVWEVLLQAKVIRQRPLAGPGARVRVLGILRVRAGDAESSGRRIRVPVSRAREASTRSFAAVFAVCVAISISGSVCAAFLGAAAMAGRTVPGIRRHRGVDSDADAHVSGCVLERRRLRRLLSRLWWAHTLALAVFLPLIPHTKHLHLVLSPVTVFLSRGGFANIPPLAGDEDFGLDTGKDLTPIGGLAGVLLRGMRALHRALPRRQHRQDSRPQKNRAGSARVSERVRPAMRKSRCWARIFRRKPCSSAPPAARANFNARWESSMCPSSSGLRRGAVNTGKWEDAYGTKLFLALERNGNALGFSSAERDKFVAQAAISDLRRHSGILPVAGLHGRVRSAQAAKSSLRSRA